MPWYSTPECGCSAVYDGCAAIIPVGCMGMLNGNCQFWVVDTENPAGGHCRYAPQIQDDIFEKINRLIHEFLFAVDLDDNGKRYGHDFVFSDPPPVLRNIPNISGGDTMSSDSYWREQDSMDEEDA